MVDRAVAELGGVDIVVNNAGGSLSRPFLETTAGELEASFHFNVAVPFELSRLAVPRMLERGGGAIVNIGSVAGQKAVRGSLTHSLTKSALGQLTRLMAIELAPRVRVNAVLPGAIETGSLRRFLDGRGASIRQAMIERTAMRRNGVPDDITPAVLYFASPASSWVSGKLLEVDGLAAAEIVPKDQPDL
jgi:7-alpha-hydroxysteroid dehydrogenase